MKLLMYRHDGGPRLGALRPGHEDEVVDLGEVAPDVLAVIDAGAPGLEQARKVASVAGRRLPLKDVTLLPPIDAPRGNIIAMGRNYQKHAEETAEHGDIKPPTIFTKAITSITGPYEEIQIDPSVSDQLDWEVELYFVLNDVSARDIQNGWGGQYFKGKSLDRSCPTGPWVVTKDDVPDPQQLDLRLTVNGVVKQEGNTGDMIHAVDGIIEWTSKGMTLLPGALIATGTPDGVGFARTPPEFLKPGDVMETEVSGIGILRNRMVPAKVRALADHSHRGA